MVTADAPRRVRMTRRKGGWRAEHPTAVRVDRVTKWGNPFRVGDPNPLGFGEIRDAAHAVELYAQWWALSHQLVGVFGAAHTWQHAHLADIRGRDLACWCELPADGEPDTCHAAFLLQVANAPELVETDPMGEPDIRRAVAALAEWGCPRPDKRHYLLQESAEAALSRYAGLEARQHALAHRQPHRDPHCDRCHPQRAPREVYRCRCGGLVIGHPRMVGTG